MTCVEVNTAFSFALLFLFLLQQCTDQCKKQATATQVHVYQTVIRY